ncbi:ADP-ribosylglycohydrolase family protein [Micromonospora sp. M71_S20]|uniref:ADP-ribosylglycohydrolase family protein n=1 Tax=Micromonospora sp. M71_S20 TaxID=592872 RepID=UPI0018F2DE4F|nr:ADP-ribosylglycohydrolase family protein [Micromonospora sp. M71_S20]
MTKVTAEQLATARGCVLGLMLGDAIGATGGTVPASGPLPATAAGQLACFTVDGLIRAHVRQRHRGICHPPSMVWESYRSWATIQGVPGFTAGGEGHRPGGWLAKVPVLAERRGSAPATVAALQRRKIGTIDEPNGTSTGAHALTRTLPVSLYPCDPAEMAALTHAGDAVAAAGLGGAVVRLLAAGRPLIEALESVAADPAGFAEASQRSLVPALAAAQSGAPSTGELTRLAPDARAVSALAGGIYAVACLPGRETVREALLFAASAGDGGHAVTVAGALLGTAHGPDALPVDWLSRLELAWTADTLARDLVTELHDSPSGGEYFPPTDPHWRTRYPG